VAGEEMNQGWLPDFVSGMCFFVAGHAGKENKAKRTQRNPMVNIPKQTSGMPIVVGSTSTVVSP
jgi:hypothetical protein